MTISRRAFNRGALSLLAAATTPAVAHAQEESPMLITKPFKIEITDAALADLQDRLGKARFPHAIIDDWSRGQPT